MTIPHNSTKKRGGYISEIIKKAFARVVICGDYVEVYKYSSPIPVGHKRTHEIVKKKEGEKRLDNLYRARQKIRRIIWSNQGRFTKFVTLTYRDTVLDVKEVRNDVKNFVRQMKRYGYDMKYLYILENQRERGEKEGNDGSLHVHMVLFIDDKINLEVLNRCWKHGTTDIGVGRNIRNLGAYVCKYLTKDNLLEFGSRSYSCSIGLNRGQEEVFYTDGYSTSAIGVHVDDVLSELDIHYVPEPYTVTFPTKDHEIFEQTISYYQGRLSQDSLYRLLGQKNIFIDTSAGETILYFDDDDLEVS